MSSIFDDFKDAAADGLGGIVERSKIGFQVSRLRNQLKRLDKDRMERLARLGERVYQMTQTGAVNQQALVPDCQAVAAADREIARIRSEIADLAHSVGPRSDAVARCTCGEALTAETRFCRGCGKDVEAIVASAVAQPQEVRGETRRCACGAPLGPMTKFCAECGKPVAQAAPVTTAPETRTQMTPPPPPTPTPQTTVVPQAPLDAKIRFQEPDTRACPLCGGEIPAAAKFCRHCGQKVPPPAAPGG